MMTGVILDNGTPVIEIKVRGSHQEIIVEGILDPGFTGFLCLPIFLAVPLGLVLTDTITSKLADGTIVDNELVFAGQAEWDGVMMDIAITLTRSDDVLIGTAFLAGYRVELDYAARTVSIEKVP
jgi:predicted aspartyl protease